MLKFLKCKKALVLFFIIILIGKIWAQKVSEKQDIAVFKLSYYGWAIPNFLLENLDKEIIECFYGLKRFNIIAMKNRVSSNNLNEFNEQIKASREKNIKIPEKVLMGQEYFTKADWEKTINSYFIVVPIVTNWEIETTTKIDRESRKKTDEYNCKASIKFYIYSMQSKDKKISEFILEDKELTMEHKIYYDIFGIKIKETFYKTASSIPFSLDRKLRGIPEFIIKSGVTKTENKKIYFELGKNLGIYKGDEYVIIGYDENNKEIETGFVVVTNSNDTISEALTLFSNQKIIIGDQIKEVPRLPIEFRPFVNTEIIFNNTEYLSKNRLQTPVFSLGLHISHTRGFYRIRPCYGFEVNFIPWLNLKLGIPITMNAGLEIWNSYFGRFQILPTAQVFFTTLVSNNGKEKFIPIESGANIFVHGSYLLNRDFKIGADLGFKIGMNMFSKKNNIFLRLIFGIGITVKF